MLLHCFAQGRKGNLNRKPDIKVEYQFKQKEFHDTTKPVTGSEMQLKE